MEYEEFFVFRLAELRQQAGVSARDMSLSMGQSPGYINKIENHQNLPSLTGFFYICDYFGISPKEFFDETNKAPMNCHKINERLHLLSKKQLTAIESIVDAMLDT